MTDNERNVCRRALKCYGYNAQKLMAIEEMSELTKEICKDFRGKRNESHIAEEIADVEIMLEQLKMIYDKGDGHFRRGVEDIISYKLIRLENRMEDSENA